MNNFVIYNKDNAPAGSDELLAGVNKAYGFTPNLLGTMAESPATLQGYLTLGKILETSSLSATEQQVVLLAVSRFNECHYCLAAHTTIADMQKVSREVVDAIRNDQPIADERLESLRRFATLITEKRGWASEDDVAEFYAAGFTQANVLEVILAASLKTISNYVNHVADTPVDGAFSKNGWTPADTAGQEVA
ncbi:MAG: carboxymuconolactone decarboxylase family protein [Pseudomonadota bacterium]